MKKAVWFSLTIVLAVVIGKVIFFRNDGSMAEGKQLYTVSKLQSICIDPGHGGIDPGAIVGSLTEAEVNLKVALKVRDELWKQGYRVYMTRVNDRGETLADRYNFCNDRKATIMVSVHQNYFDDNFTDYSTALFYKPEDVDLANSLAATAGKALTLDVTPTTEFDSGLLMKTHMPASIVESLFITNAAEVRALRKNDARTNQEAQGIVGGIVNYFASQQKTDQ